MIAFLVVTIIISVISVVAVYTATHIRNSSVSSANSKKSLEKEYSWPAGEIMKSYNDLPEMHRPAMDIEAAVKALDAKYGKPEVNGHYYMYSTSTYSNRIYTWNCPCVYDHALYKTIGESCEKYPEYYDLWHSIRQVHCALREREKARAEREHQLMLAGMESDLNSVALITAALRSEKELINEVTKEIM